MTRLIGLHGFARCGKDSVGKVIAQNFDFEKYALADPLRRASSAFYGIPVEIFHGDNPDREKIIQFWGMSPRQMLQKIGELGRERLGEDHWIKLMEKEWERIVVEHLIDDNKLLPYRANGLVVTDIRYANEAQWIIDHGGVMVRIIRPGVGPVNDHKSEIPLSDELIRYTIHNDGNLMDLNSAVNTLMSNMARTGKS